VKYEDLHKFSYLKELFAVEDDFLEYLNTKRENTFNPSISKLGVNFFLFLNRFINLEKNQNSISNFLHKPSNKYLYKIKWKLFSFLKLKEFFQYKVDKMLKVKKYYIDKSFIPIDIVKWLKIMKTLNSDNSL